MAVEMVVVAERYSNMCIRWCKKKGKTLTIGHIKAISQGKPESIERLERMTLTESPPETGPEILPNTVT
ncbi:MAG: hypothetical protein DWQ08_06230 [Proteobacteria bacterium]|nr:MAG: hypothetical protein DWQ08_06230 [Pseudomonadota bacterium]